MKKSSVSKAKKAAAKGKAKQEPEPKATKSDVYIDLHPLYMQGSASDGDFSLVGSNSGPPPELGDGLDVLREPELSLPSSISTVTIATDELFPNRFIKQAIGSSGKVAYVVFNGLSPGVFYNWASCNSSMSGMDDSARRFIGYYTYQDAHTAWDLYEQQGILPQGIPLITQKMKHHAEELRNKMKSTISLQTAAINHLRSLPPSTEGPSTPRGGVKKNFEKHPETPTRSPVVKSQQLSAPLVASSASSLSHDMSNHIWVVFQGPEPGVYPDKSSAVRALGGHNQFNDKYLIAPTLNAANALFVEHYMIGQVKRWNHDV